MEVGSKKLRMERKKVKKTLVAVALVAFALGAAQAQKLTACRRNLSLPDLLEVVQ